MDQLCGSQICGVVIYQVWEALVPASLRGGECHPQDLAAARERGVSIFFPTYLCQCQSCPKPQEQ